MRSQACSDLLYEAPSLEGHTIQIVVNVIRIELWKLSKCICQLETTGEDLLPSHGGLLAASLVELRRMG